MKEGEDFKVLKKIVEKGCAFQIVNERRQLDHLIGSPSSGCDLLKIRTTVSFAAVFWETNKYATQYQ